MTRRGPDNESSRPATAQEQRAFAASWTRRIFSILDHPLSKVAIPVLIGTLALWVLHRLSATVHLHDIHAALAATPLSDIGYAIGFTALSFAAIALYDVVSAAAVAPGALPARVTAATCAAGYALSNLLGFSYVTGAALRYRQYSSWGLDFRQVATLISYSWAGFWAGMAVLTGAILVADSAPIAQFLPMPPSAGTILGVLLLAGVAVLLWLLSRQPDRLPVFGTDIAAPRPAQGLALAAISLIELLGCALTLYALLPADIAPSLKAFIPIFVFAVALGIASHAPGGLGVLEATIISALGAGGRADVLTALLLFRVIYYGLPFLVAVVGLTVAEFLRHQDRIAPVVRIAGRVVQPLAPILAAGIAFAAGTVLLLSGNLPELNERMSLSREVLPLGVVELSHLAGSVAGVLLLVVAHGLYRRLHSAWMLAMGLLALGGVASLLKGIDVEEAAVMAIAAAVLAVFQTSFHRVRGASLLRMGPRWIGSIAVLFIALSWIGFFAFKHVDYQDALWWQVSWDGDASRFLRASLASAVVLAAVALNALLTGPSSRHRPCVPIPETVHRLIAASPDSESNIALMGDKSFLIDPEERACLAYGDTGRALVAKGDPIGDSSIGRELLWQFREMADREGKRPVFYAVSNHYLPTFLDMGLTVVRFGEVARVPLTTFSLDAPAMRKLRYARNRAEREGYRFEVIPPEDFAANLAELRRISDEWLTRKQAKEKGFALGAFDPAYLANFRTGVMRHKETGVIVAFANLLSGADTELSVDLMRYGRDGANFAMDALFAEIMLWGKDRNYLWFNLGAAPFARSEMRPLASPWQRLGGFVYEHGEPFYHFDGLRSFKEKFQPVWSPNYIVCQGGFWVAKAFLDANQLISGGLSSLTQSGATPPRTRTTGAASPRLACGLADHARCTNTNPDVVASGFSS